MVDPRDADDPEDVLSASLQSLYGFSPITFSTAGSVFTYTINSKRVPGRNPPAPKQIELVTPDIDPSNWSLHASSIWVSSLFIADHLEDLQIDAMSHSESGTDGKRTVHVLELGAGAGLPSILLAHLYPHARVTVTDYPDDRLMRTLSDNVRRNSVPGRCRAVPYAWGTSTAPLMLAHRYDSPGEHHPDPDPDPSPNHSTSHNHNGRDDSDLDAHRRFDIVLAADTLWNPELHAPFLDTLCACIGRGPDARAHLVAGLHTGRYTIQSFLDAAQRRGFVLVSTTEREVSGMHSRFWDVSRAEGEDERERRRWVVWMILKWEDPGDQSKSVL